MAKKRKAIGQPFGQNRAAKGDNHSSKLNVSTYEDVADSEDEFHINRDKILLDEGPEAKRRRKRQEQEEFLQPSDEEVLAYESPSEEEEEEDDVLDARRGKPEDEDLETSAAEDEDEDEDEDAEGWGPSKRDYYNADAIETEQDALDEEAEALRLQKKHLQGMTEADFGFDETAWLEDNQADGTADDAEGGGDVITEVLPQLEITEDMGPEERLKLLRTRYPEFEPLAKEFLDLQAMYDEYLFAAKSAEKFAEARVARTAAKDSRPPAKPVAVVKHAALAAYLAALTMYFALLTSAANMRGTGFVARSPQELRDHSIMDTLVKCRDLWSKVKDLRVPTFTEEVALATDLAAVDEEPEQTTAVAPDGGTTNGPSGTKPPRKHRKSKAERAAEAARAEAAARRAERMRRTEEDLASLSALTAPSTRRKVSQPKLPVTTTTADADDNSDFGDEAPLSAAEAALKAQRKKSLRFYTSQIVQKANKRGAAGRDAGGDADLPHRERLRDRQARLNAEAERRGRKKAAPGEALGGESDEEDRRRAWEVRDEAGEGDGEDYYDMIASRNKSRKAEKAAQAALHRRAAESGGRVVETETVGADGKRKVSYAIEKNKGLTPHRKKEVRNPRVKKRKKFEEKTKKLGSVRQVYKGGEGRGGYGGELTGIKTGLIKGVKL